MNKYKNISNENKPRERLKEYGSEYLSNEELIAIILKTGSKGYSVNEVSLKLLEIIGDIGSLKDIGINKLIEITGIGEVKAISLKAAIELGRRVYMDNAKEVMVIKDSRDIYNLLKDKVYLKKQEYFYCIYLDTKHRVIDKKCLFVGTLNNSTVHPREIFKEAYLLSANKIVVVHNHPSGDTTPSKADIMLTKKIYEIGLVHGIELVDHVIIGSLGYFSFLDNDMLC